ncbi:hypothetical protein SLEP1_g56113 [Rubroshorea leprosula]|uniref:Uncharacterized protein n=1 Tax=Rubroshorea leprosula TaxID=152421 RepID=A0AAV5MHE4_9ROSI|nr:hypothetical protein SLEP1_g56113 [Rubroshorea leprosula]
MKFAPSDDLQEGGIPSCRMGYEICLGQLQGLKHYLNKLKDLKLERGMKAT